MTICFATNNAKKIEEVKAALAGKVTILSLQ
jgi:inosine/xanthosine triphosphate pyrophosphatase family protein